MPRRALALLALGAALGILVPHHAWAHAGLRQSDPLAGVTLGDTPKRIRLTFTEKPEVSLSSIRVLDTKGAVYQIGRPAPVSGDPSSLSIFVKPLDRGVYTVSWRVVSAVDAHASSGAYAFGVRVAPTGPAAAALTTRPAASSYEVLARWILLVGLVALLGAASAGVARFGGTGELTLGAGGWLLALLGLVLLADAQRRTAAAALVHFLNTGAGRALIWRAVAIGAAGGGLFLAGWVRPRWYRVMLAIVAIAASAAMAAHVAAGHAAAADRLPAVHVAAQWAHFTSAGIWIGGLAALLFGVRGAPSAAKTAAVRRFSNIAAAGLLVVTATGLWRAVGELTAWSDLISSGYGRMVSAKIVLLLGIAALGAVNRWQSVPAAATDLRSLRYAGGAELALAAGALAAAAALGALAPPVRLVEPFGLDVSGSDYATTVSVRLTAPSDQPGPNRFVVRALDYDSRTAVRARRVSLRFTPLDDPGVESTSLDLAPGPGGTYVGSGANLTFDGRWRVTVRIEKAPGSVEIPLEVEIRIPPQSLFVERHPGHPPQYRFEMANGYMEISADPERAGRSRVEVGCYDFLLEERVIEQVVVTTSESDGALRPRPVRRLSMGRFAADVELNPGRNRIAAVAKAPDGTRLRAVVELDVPGD